MDDVQRGRVPQPKHATAELLRRHTSGQPLEDDPDRDRLPRGKNTWPGDLLGKLFNAGGLLRYCVLFFVEKNLLDTNFLFFRHVTISLNRPAFIFFKAMHMTDIFSYTCFLSLYHC